MLTIVEVIAILAVGLSERALSDQEAVKPVPFRGRIHSNENRKRCEGTARPRHAFV